MKIRSKLNLRLTSAQFVLVSSILLATIFNLPFILAVYKSVSPYTLHEWLFFVSVPILLTQLNVIILSLLGAFFLPRLTIAITFLVSSLLLYGTSTYGIIFDKSMIQNVMETNSGEAFSYINSTQLAFFFIVGLFPVFAVFSQEITGKLCTRIKHLLKVNVIAIVGVMLLVSFFYKDYAAVGRNNKELTKYIIPYAFYDSSYKYLRDTYFYPPLPFKVLDKKPKLKSTTSPLQSTVVLVVGETARSDKFSSNGYLRSTTPNIQNAGAISFKDVSSCGTATAVSVPCMFSRLPRSKYDARVAESQDNALDIIHRAGVDVVWIDNNSSCKGVCKRITTIEFNPAKASPLCDGDYCYDEILVQQLRDTLSKPTLKNRLIILHMIGSHGPTYYRRYPSKFAQFLPDCPKSDIQNCSEKELINTYDNTIVYTDFVLGEIIKTLSELPNSSMLYISDHGESLGEKGLYLHGFPYSIAPVEQTHIPLIYWSKKLNNSKYRDCMSELAERPYSQDNLFDTLLGMSNIVSTSYEPKLDILSQCDG